MQPCLVSMRIFVAPFHKFTNNMFGMDKNILKRNNIQITENADKTENIVYVSMEIIPMIYMDVSNVVHKTKVTMHSYPTTTNYTYRHEIKFLKGVRLITTIRKNQVVNVVQVIVTDTSTQLSQVKILNFTITLFTIAGVKRSGMISIVTIRIDFKV